MSNITNQLANDFMDNPNSLSDEDVFDLFRDTFNVTDDQACAFLNGYKFKPEDHKDILKNNI